ncbi:hypothetical protein [Lysinibacter sp. HNR]|nr:hypothetical protein [Lysinibacter sp. HNR]WGD38355.1 hypothetical protein FrondiHNR_05440 [Lysinibacter sp. HNR]
MSDYTRLSSGQLRSTRSMRAPQLARVERFEIVRKMYVIEAMTR